MKGFTMSKIDDVYNAFDKATQIENEFLRMQNTGNASREEVIQAYKDALTTLLNLDEDDKNKFRGLLTKETTDSMNALRAYDEPKTLSEFIKTLSHNVSNK